MKIDIHVHTKKTKQGDAKTREISAQEFQEIVSDTEVKILAITNHNVFDFDQYEKLSDAVANDDVQVWPGVELDVVEGGRRGHLLVIVSPTNAKSFEEIVNEVSDGMTPDSFTISIDKVLEKFDHLGPLYVAHYKNKKPDLLDSDIENIAVETNNKNRVLKEAANAVSAGIFVSHGHASIFGSDVRDWSRYVAESKKLPDLRLPVESFEQFCLLLDKDLNAINTLLDKKYPEEITIHPFPDKLPLTLTVYDDINVFFGSKGTGKSDILKAIASYYSNKGKNAKRYVSNSGKLEDIYDFGGKKLKIDLNDHGIEYCNKEIGIIRNSQEIDITSMGRYRQHFAKTLTNRKAVKIKVKDFQKLNVEALTRDFNGVQSSHNKFEEFIAFVNADEPLKNNIKQERIDTLKEILCEFVSELDEKRFNAFVQSKSASFFNNLIDKVNDEISRKTGNIAKPVETGFFNYALNRIKVEMAAKTILINMEKKIEIEQEYVGDLDKKGQLFCKTEVKIQNGGIRDGNFKPVENVNKTPQTEFSRLIKSICKEAYSQKLFNKISELNSIESIETVPTLLELLIFKKDFMINDDRYEPSTGEASMILLHKELSMNKDVYILDEPERSLGNEYINNVVVPLIKEKAKNGKKVFIATHDANIAVRTLPYSSIYRHHDHDGYKTYVGNPFSNYLINISNSGEREDWKNISMRMLEGGVDAFGERGKIYGNA